MTNIYKNKFLKLSLFILIFLCFFCFAGCNDEDENNGNVALEGEGTVTGTGITEEGFSYEILDNNRARLTKYEGLVEEILIPEKVMEKPVVELGTVFEYKNRITSIIIPETVIKFDKRTFSGCSGLVSINIPKNLIDLGTATFYNCINLIKINIPGSLTKIGAEVFFNCNNLKNIDIPQTIIEIGANAFSNCINLTSIYLPASIKSIGSSAFSGCEKLNSIKVTEGITEIAENTFDSCLELSIIELPVSLQKICNSAFLGCKNLKSLELPKNVTFIGDDAFKSSGLSEINITDNITNIGTGAFYCTSITAITIPVKITKIAEMTFAGCTKLTNVVLHSAITTIGDFAFENCTSLKVIDIPVSVSDIGKNAFTNTLWLNKAKEKYIVTNCGSLIDINLPEDEVDVIIPDNVKTIAACAPNNRIQSVTFPAGLVDCGDFVKNERKLKSITVDENNAVYSSVDGVLFNKDKTILLCYPQKKDDLSYTIPDSVTKIQMDSWNCANIKTLIIPKSIDADSLTYISGINNEDGELRNTETNEEKTKNLSKMSIETMFNGLSGLETVKFMTAKPNNAKMIEKWFASNYVNVNIIWGYTGEEKSVNTESL